MNSTELDVKHIYDLANQVYWKLGKTVSDAESVGLQYEDESISIYQEGYYHCSFSVYQRRRDYHSDLVLETHQVQRRIDTKEELLRDMLHHGFCDSACPGFRRAVAQRAYEIYLHRDMCLSSDLDDWLQAEKEILHNLEEKYSGDWEVLTLYGSEWMEGKPVACVILKRGAWIEHLINLSSTCS